MFASASVDYSESHATGVSTIPSEAVCELHIFPVRVMAVVDQTQNKMMGGLLTEFINDAYRVKKPEEIVKFLRESVPIDYEIEVIKLIDYKNTKKGANSNLVVNENPIDGAPFYIKTSPPIVENPPKCYHELVLYQFYYEKGTLHKSIKTAYLYREFVDSKMSAKPESGIEGVEISNFPPSDYEDFDPARAVIRNAYRDNIIKILNKK